MKAETNNVYAAFDHACFTDWRALEKNRGCEPVRLTEEQFIQVACECDYLSSLGTPSRGDRFIARLIDPLVHVVGPSGEPDVEILLAIARDEHGRFWSMAVPGDETNEAILDRLALRRLDGIRDQSALS